MILICDLSFKSDSLSYYEYVNPIEEIVISCGHEFKTLHYNQLSEIDCLKADAVILCGTALMDNGFLEKLDKFIFLKEIEIPVLGVCAGVQVIVKLFGGEIIPNKKIGMTGVFVTGEDPLFKDKTTFEAYELHNNLFLTPDCFLIIGKSESGVQAIKHKNRPLYGVVFHPEVRNEWVVKNFLELSG